MGPPSTNDKVITPFSAINEDRAAKAPEHDDALLAPEYRGENVAPQVHQHLGSQKHF